MKNLKNYFKGFTLVELIIVITILAILATIAFIGFQNFAKDSRDGNRIATLTQIEKGLNLVQIQTGKYPLPDGNVLTGALNLGGSELIYSHMGIIDENISRLIKINKTPLDPVSNSKYVYAVNNQQDKYQIATLLESLEANTKLPLIEQTYANENYKAKVIGNHQVNVKVPKDDKIWLTTVPSMIFNPEGGNILNSSGTYHIINGGQNLPYKTNDKIITSKETGDKIIQHIRKSQDAKIITVDITDIVNEKNETTRKTLIETKFGTGSETEEVLPGITSKEALASIGAITGTNEIPNTTILTQTVESIITGGSVSTASTYTPPKTPATCGTANKSYENTETTFGTDTFCSVGTLDGENPTFPSQGNSVNWTCISPDGGASANCSATKLNPNEELKLCSGKPDNSKYYNGSDTHSVTVSFGSPAPTPNYAEIPSENSCDYVCNAGFTHQSGACNDITPPTGGSFTIPETTNSTGITLTITCPTDAAGSTPIEIYISGDIIGTPAWENCVSSKNITLTTGDGSKAITMKWRDSEGNETSPVVSKNITLNSVINLVMYDSARRWSDGSYALSCNGYKNPTGSYNYSGSTGDGLYWIKPDTNPAFKVYCDMTTDGGGWTLVMRGKGGNVTGWDTTGDLNLGNSLTIDNTFKFSDSKINGILGENGFFLIKTDGTYSYKSYFKKTIYNHLGNIQTNDKGTSYIDLTLSSINNQGDLNYSNWCGLSDIKYSSYGWGNYPKSSILLNGTSGSGCSGGYWWIGSTLGLKQGTEIGVNIQVWIK